jgi:EmrB/QacA subfamily drug resistance transporter
MPAWSASAPIEAVPGALPSPERAAVALVALATMLAPLNSTMIAVALPRIIVEYGGDVSRAGWLVTAYLIAMAALQPVAGKLGDRLGRRALILGGVAWFGAASLGAAAAGSLSALLCFRVQQAIAGAIALPNGAALIREVVPPERRASRFGLVGGAIALAAAAGPPLGGLLVGLAGWRSIFYVNLLFVLPALAIGWRSVPARPKDRRARPFDLGGAVLLSAVLVGAAGLASRGARMAPSAVFLAALALGALLAIFLWRALRHPDPVLQPRLFGQRVFAAANAAIALSNLAMYSTMLAVPLLLAGRTGWDSTQIGAALTAMSGGMVVCAPLGGRLADRLGRRWPTVSGLTLLTLGLLPLAVSGIEIGTRTLLGGLGLVGIGVGLASSGLQTAAIESVGPEESGAASGIFSTSRYLGSIVGSSLLGSLLGPLGNGAAGFGLLFAMAAGAACLSALASLGLREPGR